MGRIMEMKERYEKIAIPEELHVRVQQEIMKSRRQQEEKNKTEETENTAQVTNGYEDNFAVDSKRFC